MIPGAVHRSSGIYFTAEEKPGKPELGDHLMKAMRPVIALSVFPCLKMTSVGSHSTPRSYKKGKRERLGRLFLQFYRRLY